jgi:hypothetical protein
MPAVATRDAWQAAAGMAVMWRAAATPALRADACGEAA